MRAIPAPEMFQLMAQRVQDYAIFLLDPGGHVISWNDGARRLKQYAEDEIIGKHFSVLYTAEDKQRDWPASELQRAVVDGRFEDAGWRVRKDGSRFWANVIITALRDDAGQLVAFSKITRDLTERKMQEEALRESEERFRLLVDGVQDYAIYMLSPDGVVTSWNLGARRIKGYQSAEILGKHFARFYGPEDIEAGKPWAELAMAREHGRAEDEGWRIRKDGTRFWARVVVTSLHDSDGKLRGFANVTQDLTHRRHSQALESAARQTSDFVAVLSHELRNPLAPIRNAVTLLKDTRPGDPDYEVLRQAVDRQSLQLSRIVDDLLDISRISRGTFTVKQERIDLAEVLARALEAARPGIDAAKHALTIDLPVHPAFVQGDELRLTQALTNILNNAARYSDHGSRIIVTLRKEEGASNSLALSIRDTGRGIEPQLLGTIFGMFVQGRDSLSQPQAGLGVGLALTRTIVELHHGTIEAKSEGAGKGSEFIIRLPLAEKASVAAAPGSAPSTEKQSMRRVLVVDDNVDAAVLLSALIRNLGHDVLTVHDGAEALQISEGYRPDVVMLDIGMPGMNGYEVARRMRGRNRSPRPLIVAVTGWGKPEDAQRSREAGFDVHLVKPVETAQIRQVLETA